MNLSARGIFDSCNRLSTDNSTQSPFASVNWRRRYKFAASAMAIAAAFGWTGKADAFQECGTPSGDTVQCNDSAYLGGIEYGVDDLTVVIGNANPVSVSGGSTADVYSHGAYSEFVHAYGNVTLSPGNLSGTKGIEAHAYDFYSHDTSATAEIESGATVNVSGTGLYAHAYAGEGNNQGHTANSYAAVFNLRGTGAPARVITSGDANALQAYADSEVRTYDSYVRHGASAVATIVNTGYAYSADGFGADARATTNIHGDGNFFAYAGNVSNPVETDITIRNATSAGPLPFVATQLEGYSGNIASPAIISEGSDAVFAHLSATVNEPDGGNSHTNLTIYNAAGGTIASFGSGGDGIYFNSLNTVTADGGEGGSHAVATSVGNITNNGLIFSEQYHAIHGCMTARAYNYNSHSGRNEDAVATSTMTVLNQGNITGGLVGGHNATYFNIEADAKASHGDATATSGLIISNTQGGTVNAGYSGLYGYSTAIATTETAGYHAIATSNLTFQNSGTIHAQGDGIYGNSTAKAYGVTYAHATANATLENFSIGNQTQTGGTLTGVNDDGIDLYAFSKARVNGNASTATADTNVFIFNDDTIVAGDDGIDTPALAKAYGNDSGNTTAVAMVNTYVHNTGSIHAIVPSVTDLDNAVGVYARGYSYAEEANTATAQTSIVVVNSGAVTADQGGSTHSAGLYAGSWSEARGYYTGDATATANVDNRGQLTAIGNSSFGIFAQAHAYSRITTNSITGSSLATALVDVRNYAGITAGYDGIYTLARPNAVGDSGGALARADASAYIYNSANITVTGNGSNGVFAFGNSSASNSFSTVAETYMVVRNKGNITAGLAGGNSSDGIHAYSEALSFGESTADASAFTTVLNYGAIKVFGNYARGIFAGAYAYATASTARERFASVDGAEGAKVVVYNTATIKTYGHDSPAIRARAEAVAYGYTSDANAYANVTNKGTLSTTGYYSPGILATAVAYAADTSSHFDPHAGSSSVVVNSGGITTLHDYSPGIINAAGAVAGSFFGAEGGVSANAYTYTHNTTSITTGNGNGTTGYFSPAILAASAAVANLPEGTNSNNILNLSGFGLNIGSGVNGVINNDNFSFDIGNFSGTGSFAASATAEANIFNSGTLTTHGDASPGILGLALAYAYGTGNATVANANVTIANHGDIVTFGCYSMGIAALAGGFGNGTYSDGSGSSSTATISVTNTANITTTGNYAFGIFALAAAIPASADSEEGTGTALINITTSGNISATGIGSDGIFAAALGSTNANISIHVTGGSVRGGVAGEGGIFGLQSILRHTDHVTPNQLPSFLNGFYGGVGIEAFSTGSIDVQNEGTISAVSDYALDLFSLHGNTTVTNKSGGTIIGLASVEGYNASFDNKGTWVVRGVGYSGIRQSDVSNYSTSVYGRSIIYGFGEEGSGILINETGAKMLIVGNQEIDVSRFTNMGLVSLAERDTTAYESGPGRGEFEKLVIGGDYVSNGGRLALDVNLETGKHDFVEITGSASGTTAVEVVPGGGTPHATTGNGIPLIEVHGAINGGQQAQVATGNGADDFQLVGNTSNPADHKLIAGIFEYDLNLVPGNGNVSTGGTWYLQSHPVFDFANINAGALTAFGMSSISFGDLLSNIPLSEIQGAENENGDYPKIASADPGFIPGRPTEVGRIGMWGRFIGNSLDVSPGGSPAPFGVQMALSQIGADYAFRTPNGGALVLGAFAGYADATLDFDSSTANGALRGGVYGAYGLFVTGKWEAGLLASIGDTSLKYHNPSSGTNFSVNPSAYGLSGMIARRFDLDDDVFFQPRIEYTFAHTGGFGFSSFGVPVDVSSTESSVGLLAVRAGKSFQGGNGAMFAPYIDLGVENEFAGSTTVSGSGIALSTTLQGVEGKFGGGLNVLLMNRVSLFGRVDYVTGDTMRGVKGFAGVRFIAD